MNAAWWHVPERPAKGVAQPALPNVIRPAQEASGEPPARNDQYARKKSGTFYRPAIHSNLDTYRSIGKNTHELIVLPVLRQVLPAKCFGLRRAQKPFSCRPVSQGPPSPTGKLLGERFRRSIFGPRTSMSFEAR